MKYKIITDKGLLEIEGEPVGKQRLLAIHETKMSRKEYPSEGWSVDLVPTGHRITHAKTKREAERLVRKITQKKHHLQYWEAVAADPENSAKYKGFHEIKQILTKARNVTK